MADFAKSARNLGARLITGVGRLIAIAITIAVVLGIKFVISDAIRGTGSGEIVGGIAMLLVALVALGLMVGCCYIVWRIISNFMLFLRNSKLRMELERQELEALRAEKIALARRSGPPPAPWAKPPY